MLYTPLAVCSVAIAYLSEEFCEKNLKLGVLKKICVLIAGKQAFFT